MPDAATSTTLPRARELTAACRRTIVEWHEREAPLDWEVAAPALARAGDGWPAAVANLCLVNCFQWHLEDECRTSAAEPARLAHLKREIDASNGRRVRAVDAIDARLARELGDGGRADASAPVALVTPGNLLDRITILELKRHHARDPEVAAIVEEQLEDSCLGLDRLVADLAARRQRMKLYPTVKLYGDGR